MSCLKKSLFIVLFIISFPVISSTEPAAAFKRVHLDEQAPVFVLKDLNGNDLNLAEYSDGPLTIVVFWAMWSTRSGPMLSDVQKIVDEFGSKGVRALSINVDQSETGEDLSGKVRAFLQEHGISFPTAIDADMEQYNAWGVIATPATAFLVKDRKVVYLIAGHPTSTLSDMREQTMEALGIKEEVAEAAKPKRERYKPAKATMRNFGMAKVQFQRKQASKAARKLDKVLKDDPDFPEAHALDGAIKLALHREGKEGAEAASREAFNKAVELDATVPLGLAGVAHFALEDGDVAKALEYAGKAVEYTEISELPELPAPSEISAEPKKTETVQEGEKSEAVEKPTESATETETAQTDETETAETAETAAEEETETAAAEAETAKPEIAEAAADDKAGEKDKISDAASEESAAEAGPEAVAKEYLSLSSAALEAGKTEKAKELLNTLVEGLMGIPEGPKMREAGVKMRQMRDEAVKK